MDPIGGRDGLLAPSLPAVTALFVDERDRDTPGVSIPHPELHLVARFGPSTRSGLDVHVLGGRQEVHRKLIRSGQRTVMARLQLGLHEAVLGVSPAAVSGAVVALEELWGPAATRRLCDRLSAARSTVEAAAVLERAIAERSAASDDRAPLVVAAAARLTRAPVHAVAAALGMSERHLRRVFHQAVGVSPKAFARLARFRRALRLAREDAPASWADIAAAAGYYDQAHLITEFRVIAGTTPQGLQAELRTALSVD